MAEANFPVACDVASRSSSPHLFLDSSSSGCSDDGAEGFCSSSFDMAPIVSPATPHIFLCYAKRHDTTQSNTDRPLECNDNRFDAYNNFLGRERSSISGLKAYHVTENCKNEPKQSVTANNSGDEVQSTQAGQETSETRQDDVIDWKHLSCEFACQCKRYMAEQLQLSESRAKAVSAALGQAFADAASRPRVSCNTTSYENSKRRCFEKYASVVDKAFLVDLSGHFSHEHDDLMDVCREQLEELKFLRAALKHLVLFKDFEKSAPVPELTAEDSICGHARGIPNHIVIRNDVIVDLAPCVEDSSELTPSEGDFHDMISIPLQPPSPLSNCFTAGAGVKTIPFIYPHLEKGEIKGQHARWLDFFMYMNDAQSLLQGKYSGKISLDTGLPHGKGVFRFDNGDFYIGDFLNGMMHGDGCLFTRKRKNLLKLRGTFQNNDFYGDGSLLGE
jgi:hypothetical protein